MRVVICDGPQKNKNINKMQVFYQRAVKGNIYKLMATLFHSETKQVDLLRRKQNASWIHQIILIKHDGLILRSLTAFNFKINMNIRQK